MSAPCCAYTKPNGDPCAAHPLPASEFCLFHDPDRAESLAAARGKGGSTPRRRFRRFPRVLDHLHVAELLSELFITALNDPDAIDTKRLQALTTLARTLLQAVGIPKHEALVHADHTEPPAAADHLLRVYPPLPSDLDTEVTADLRAGAAAPEHQSTRTPEPPNPEQAVNSLSTGLPAREALLDIPPADSVERHHRSHSSPPEFATSPRAPAPNRTPHAPAVLAEAAAVLAQMDHLLSRETSASLAASLAPWNAATPDPPRDDRGS